MVTVKGLGKLGEDILVHALNTLRLEHNAHPEKVNLHLRTVELPPGGKLSVAGKVKSLPTSTKTLYVFADLDPLANWGHPVRHLFYNPKNGQLVHSEYGHFPPHEFEADPKAFEPLHAPVVHCEGQKPSVKKRKKREKKGTVKNGE